MHTLIATFYAYKGGTGRTLAVANVARFLAEELGYRVGLVDLDLELPGLIHEPLCPLFERTKEAKIELLKILDDTRGFIDCFLDRQPSCEKSSSNVNNYVFALGGGQNGGLILMPAGCGSVSKDERYRQRLNDFVSVLGSNKIDMTGEITWGILKEFSSQYQLDFLFIDGRTGAGPFFSSVYMYSIPHLLVLFSGLNEQNVTGCLSTLQTIDQGASGEVPVLFVASPVPTVGPAENEARLSFVRAALKEARKVRDANGDETYRYRLPQTIDYFLPYSDAAAFGEVYFPGKYPNSALARAYRELAQGIATTVVRPSHVEKKHVVAAAARRNEKIRIALENVHVDILKIDGLELDPEHFGAEDRRAPWEYLIERKDPKEIDALIAGLPDIVVMPQTHLQELSTKFDGRLFHTLSSLHNELGEVQSSALDFATLDSYFANWRRWCSNDRGLVGLPFSVNAMLLCANAKLLTPICNHYWRERGQSPINPFFLPSSWEAVSALLKAGARHSVRPSQIFRIVSSKRGLYYEWLNFTASMGGFDLIKSEGRLLRDVHLNRPETIEGTQHFVELARQAGRSRTMDAQVKAFSAGKLAMYIAFTDSFRFTRSNSDGRLTGIHATPLQIGGGNPRRLQDIRLGHNPRDMRYLRTTLVDGWVMTFPKKNTHSLRRALEFAERFLNPAEQRRLLGKGFPSPSSWAVDQQIEQLKTERMSGPGYHNGRRMAQTDINRENAERGLGVLLETLKLAIHSGKWIGSPHTNTPFERAMSDALEAIISDEAKVDAALNDLAAKYPRYAAGKD